jgi:hypothetical protein
MAIIDGEMLGDGHLHMPSSFQASFAESGSRKEWIQYLQKKFDSAGIPTCPVVKRKDKDNEWCMKTTCTIELGDTHRRWYIKNPNFKSMNKRCFTNRKFIKRVPPDICLSQKTMLHWFIGDGTVRKGSSGKLCTNGFLYEECELLRYALLRDFGIKTTHSSSGEILLPRKELCMMLEIIGPCPVACYAYKWNVSWMRNRHPNTSIDMRAVEAATGWDFRKKTCYEKGF